MEIGSSWTGKLQQLFYDLCAAFGLLVDDLHRPIFWIGRIYLAHKILSISHNYSQRIRSEEHTSELQSHRDLHSFPTRRSSDLFGLLVDDLHRPIFWIGRIYLAHKILSISHNYSQRIIKLVSHRGGDLADRYQTARGDQLLLQFC